ncbi:hypothetical protein Avbf_13212 [Armadillidium vulgare]|nr:hypothetical protein Avbf_13212 [Armadillidium vulgare]
MSAAAAAASTDYGRAKEFILRMNEQWIGEIYLLNKGFDLLLQSLLSQPSASTDTTTITTEEGVTGSSLQPQIPIHPQFDLETFKQQRKERKERKRYEREQRRKARKEKALLKKAQAQQEKLEQLAKEVKNNDSFDEDDIVIKEAMTEVPELGSPVPDYEVYNDDDLDEEEEKKVPFTPLPLPPEKGILIVPTFRIIRSKERKSVSFADGVMPGYGTSPSGGEEIHSPPPQLYQDKEKKKKLRKKKKVRVKVIKQYVLGDTRMDSPPPPPDLPPPANGVLKLYPGCTHYTCTAPGTFVIYTQQPVKVNGASSIPGLGNASNVTIPPGMLIHSSALSRRCATDSGSSFNGGLNSIPSSMPHSFPEVTSSTTITDSLQQTQYFSGDPTIGSDIGGVPLDVSSPSV